jgi:hypothetical protein
MLNISTAVALFAFNRPDHLKETLERIHITNDVEKLYIFCDGPRNDNDVGKINEIKRIVDKVDWCKVEWVLRQHNHGICQNVYEALSELFNKYEAVVCLEDDCLVRRDFFKYMKTCLSYYKDHTNVFHVNGFQLPIKPRKRDHREYDVYYSRMPMSWGYGLWSRSFKFFKMDISANFERVLSTDAFLEFELMYPEIRIELNNILLKKVDSFAFRWGFAMWANNGYALAPYYSLLKNIGCDGSGANFTRNRSFKYSIDFSKQSNDDFMDGKIRLPNDVYRDRAMDQKYAPFYGRGIRDRLELIKGLTTRYLGFGV